MPLVLPGDLPDDDEDDKYGYGFINDEHENWCRWPSEACLCDYEEEEETDGSDYYYADPTSDER